jgi:hypothetical protein
MCAVAPFPSSFLSTTTASQHPLARIAYCDRPNFFSSSRKFISMIVGRPCGQV